jgi:general secretion pathway protein G
MTDRKQRLSSRAGVTILEVLIVLAIIALIAAVVGPRLIGYLGRARTETASLQIRQIDSAVQLFYIDVGRYPTAGEGLNVLMAAPAGTDGWAGPYLESAEALKDPWGRDYLLDDREDGEKPRIQSLGRDGIAGGSGEDEDLSN